MTSKKLNAENKTQKFSTINLYIFNLATDSENVLLAPAVDWIRSFSKKCENVKVYSTHVGRYDLPKNVTVNEIGGGTFSKRLIGLIKILYFALNIIFSNKKNKIVFHHMSPRTAWIAGPMFRLAGVKQGLWYAHFKKNHELFMAMLFMNFLFASAPISFPFKTKKVNFIGQGIVASKFITTNYNDRAGIISVCRIHPIKSIDRLIISAGECGFQDKVILVGPLSKNESYLNYLLELSKKMNVNCEYVGIVPNEELIKYLEKTSMIYTGNLNTVDKSSIEGAISGNLVLSISKDVQLLTGMNRIWKKMNLKTDTIAGQIKAIESQEKKNLEGCRKELSELAQKRNDVDILTQRILHVLTTNKKFKFETEYN